MQTFEIHIAIPKTNSTITEEIFKELSAIGISKNKFFIEVYDVPTDPSHPNGTPPTGHDLDMPGSMSTVKVHTMSEAVALAHRGMSVLEAHDIKGNFEIEEIIGLASTEQSTIDREIDMPGYKQIADSPDYENHVVWKQEYSELPSYQTIIEHFKKELGTAPHQIVDFGYTSEVGDSDAVSRVATIYQPSREATLEFAQKLQKLGLENMLGCKYTVSERVHMVGEAIS